MSVSDESLRLAEALIFASAAPVALRVLKPLLPEEDSVEAVVEALRARYAGRGVELAEVGGGLQFRTAPDLAPRLTRVIEVPRRLPRVAMETLAIIAYRQPVTRGEIEEVRGTALSQNTLDALLEGELIAPCGRKDSPGRPTLWATTPNFLAKFGLKSLSDLPRREDLINDSAAMGGLPADAMAPPSEPGDADGVETAEEAPDQAAKQTDGQAEAQGEGQPDAVPEEPVPHQDSAAETGPDPAPPVTS